MNVAKPVVRFSRLTTRTGRFISPAESSFRVFSPDVLRNIGKSPLGFIDLNKSLLKTAKFKVWINKRPSVIKHSSLLHQGPEEISIKSKKTLIRHQRTYSATKRSTPPLTSEQLTIKKITPQTPCNPRKVLQKQDLKFKTFTTIRPSSPNPKSSVISSSSSSPEALKSRLNTDFR